MAINLPLLQETFKTSPHSILSLLLIFVAALTITGFSTIQTQTLPLHHMMICEQSVNKESCLAMVWEAARQYKAIDNHDLLKAFLKKTTPRIQEAIKMTNNVSHRVNISPKDQAALFDCAELMDRSKDRVMDSILTLLVPNLTAHFHEDVHTWLSSVLTNYVTCLDGLEEGSYVKSLIESRLNELILRARTSLAILVSGLPLEFKAIEPLMGDFPTWVDAGDRRLLRALGKEIKPNIVVAKDGSGDYKTLNEAWAAVPKNSKSRFVIFVTRGIYEENVEFASNLKNVMLVGDGMDYTIITGSLNVVDGSTTYRSANSVNGEGFIAQDICFQNTAGPEKHQAVALRLDSDKSVINRCRIDAYQDTLYAHSQRQFFRESIITGTVDFIFGNSAVVLQRCKIVPRKPMAKQKNTVTAQGRTDPNQNTGTSIQNCEIFASPDLEPVMDTFKSYLGRPWKEYSRVVVMQSYISDVIDPAGWLAWDGDFALSTLYYGEYANRGPGAGTSKRVKWPGYHVITNPEVAEQFTVAELIQGGSWLEDTGVDYTDGLYA